MARQPRADAPGAFHHVWTRGVDRRLIFLDERDRADLVARLGDVLPPCGTSLFGWCLLDNHFHAVIQSGEVPIGAVLRRVLTGYALRFNRRRERFGYLFQGRFGSRRIVDDADLRTAIRYVHRNPLESGIVADLDALERHPWCGHGALMGARPPHPFEGVAAALEAFGDDVRSARRALRAWMDAGDAAPSDPGADPGRAPLDALVRAVCDRLRVDPSVLEAERRHPRASEARAIVAYLAVDHLGIRTRDVAAALRVSAPAVSQARRRGRIGCARWGITASELGNLLNS